MIQYVQKWIFLKIEISKRPICHRYMIIIGYLVSIILWSKSGSVPDSEEMSFYWKIDIIVHVGNNQWLPFGRKCPKIGTEKLISWLYNKVKFSDFYIEYIMDDCAKIQNRILICRNYVSKIVIGRHFWINCYFSQHSRIWSAGKPLDEIAV